MVYYVVPKNPLQIAVDLHLGIILGRRESRSPRLIL